MESNLPFSGHFLPSAWAPTLQIPEPSLWARRKQPWWQMQLGKVNLWTRHANIATTTERAEYEAKEGTMKTATKRPWYLKYQFQHTPDSVDCKNHMIFGGLKGLQSIPASRIWTAEMDISPQESVCVWKAFTCTKILLGGATNGTFIFFHRAETHFLS